MSGDRQRRKVLRILATAPFVPSAVAGFVAGCESDSKDAPGQAAAEGQGASETAAPVQLEGPWKGKAVHHDLVEHLSFASLAKDGLWIDFGTTDAFKYTLGGWRTGWGRNLSHAGVDYTHAIGKSSRIYFHSDGAQDVVARFRIKRVGATFFSLYVNNEPVKKVDITKVDWHTYNAEVPASLLKKGINQILFRWEKTTKAMGEEVAAAVDHVHLAHAGRASEKLSHASLAKQLKGKDGQTSALLLPAGATLSYWMQVPHGAPMLGFDALVLAGDSGAKADKAPADKAAGGPGDKAKTSAAGEPMGVHVQVVADGAAPVTLIDETVEPGKTHKPLAAGLEKLSGQVVRLDVSAKTGGKDKVALLKPSIYVNPPAAASAPKKKAKNVIVVMEDTLRADRVQSYGPTRVKTPQLEKFAKDGVVFERYSAVEDWTKPSCATMLTGLYPDTHKTQSDSAKLPGSVRMVTEELKDQGVATGGFIANGYVSDKFGFGKGWDAYTNYIRETKNSDAENVFRDAYGWIEKQHKAGQRFYAYVHTIDPHVPYAPPQEFLELYDKKEYKGGIKPRSTANLLEDIKKGKFKPSERDKQRIQALYDGEISYHDRWFGDFMDKLDKLGLLEDTLVVVVSDHGEEFWDHGNVGHGHQIHQELIHVPFVMRWKGTLPSGKRVADNADHCSLVPTIFDAMGLKAPDYLEAESLLARAAGEVSSGPHAGFSTHQGERMAVWSERWKLLHRGPVSTQLYDLDEDARCEKSLDDERPVTLTYMRALLGQFKGAPNKARWRSRELGEAQAVQAKAESVEMDAELNEQLKALGYFR